MLERIVGAAAVVKVVGWEDLGLLQLWRLFITCSLAPLSRMISCGCKVAGMLVCAVSTPWLVWFSGSSLVLVGTLAFSVLVGTLALMVGTLAFVVGTLALMVGTLALIGLLGLALIGLLGLSLVGSG